MIGGSAKLGVCAGSLHVLNLSGHGPDMLPVRSGFFGGGGTLVDPTIAAVITDMRDVGYVDTGVVDVVDYVDVYAIDRRVIEEMSAVPPAALIAVTTK